MTNLTYQFSKIAFSWKKETYKGIFRAIWTNSCIINDIKGGEQFSTSFLSKCIAINISLLWLRSLSVKGYNMDKSNSKDPYKHYSHVNLKNIYGVWDNFDDCQKKTLLWRALSKKANHKILLITCKMLIFWLNFFTIKIV